jgi:hypothetical protein
MQEENTSGNVRLNERLGAAENMDWGQVVMNGGPPCFHLDEEYGGFCGRAKRWDGHRDGFSHRFVSLADLLRVVSA